MRASWTAPSPTSPRGMTRSAFCPSPPPIPSPCLALPSPIPGPCPPLPPPNPQPLPAPPPPPHPWPIRVAARLKLKGGDEGRERGGKCAPTAPEPSGTAGSSRCYRTGTALSGSWAWGAGTDQSRAAPYGQATVLLDKGRPEGGRPALIYGQGSPRRSPGALRGPYHSGASRNSVPFVAMP